MKNNMWDLARDQTQTLHVWDLAKDQTQTYMCGI